MLRLTYTYGMKYLLLPIVLIFSVNTYATKWEKLTEDNDGNAIYIDTNNIESYGGRVYYRSLIDFLKPKWESYSVISKYKVDCGEEQMTWLSTTYHSRPMGEGKIVIESAVQQIRFPQLDRIARDELLFVCSN